MTFKASKGYQNGLLPTNKELLLQTDNRLNKLKLGSALRTDGQTKSRPDFEDCGNEIPTLSNSQISESERIKLQFISRVCFIHVIFTDKTRKLKYKLKTKTVNYC